MNFSQRLLQLIELHDGNISEFARKCNAERANISSIVNKGTNPSAELAAKIVAAFPQLNARWLLTGKGAMWEPDELPQPKGKFSDNDAQISASEPVIPYQPKQFEVTQVHEPANAAELEIMYLKKLLAQKEITITALQKLVQMHENKLEK